MNFPEPIKKLLITYLVIIAIGIAIGLLFVQQKGHSNPSGIVENYRGSESSDEFEIPDIYPKPIENMLLTTHNHILGLAPIILSLSLIYFYVNPNKKYSTFFMTEPLISLFVTFGSLWLVRFVNPNFALLTIISATLMYFSIYFMIFKSLIHLLKSK